MRVALLTYSSKPRGSVVHAACLAEALTRLGVDATLYALSKDGDAFFRELGAELVLLPAEPAAAGTDALIRQRIAEMARGLERTGARGAIYHAEDCLAANGLLQAQRSLQPAATVRTVHHVERFASPYLADCQHRSVLGVDGLFVVSRLTEREVRAEFDRPARVISNGVWLERFGSRDLARKSALRARLGVSPGGLLITSVGGVEERKNTLSALEAVAAVHAAAPAADVHWAIAGGASVLDHSAYDQAFRQRLSELGPELGARIRRLGTLEEAELTLLYQASDVLFCPSLQEGFGLSVLEALAAGTAVLVSDREPFSDWLPRGAARFVDPEDPAALSAGLLALVLDPGERRRLAQGGPDVARRFGWERVAEAHLDEYAALLTRGARAPAVTDSACNERRGHSDARDAFPNRMAER